MIQRVEEVELSNEDFTYLKGWALTEVQQQHKAVKLQCHDDRLSLSIDGFMNDVNEVKSKLPQYLVHSKIPVSLQPEALKFLHDDQPGRQKLNTMLKGHPEVIPYFTNSANSQLFFLLLCSNSHIDRAEHVATTIQQEIVVQSVDLPQSFSRQISDSKFALFRTNLAKKCFFSATVHKNKLTLVSIRSSIADVSREFHTFVTEACSVTDVIHFKRGVWRLLHSTSMEKKWTDFVENMKMRGIMIVSLSKPSAQKPYIKIRGEVHNLEFAKEKILEFQAAVKEQQVVISRSHPGMGKYFLSNPQGQTMLKGIEYEAKVCIEVEVIEQSMAAGRSSKIVAFGTTAEIKRVNVIVGDITEFDRADVIVNAANGQLAHGTGGLAAAIVKRGGPVIQEDSKRYIDKNGFLSDGNVVLFQRAGNLPYKAIVHAVGPRWNRFGDNARETALLKKAVRQSLEKSKGYTSIAIPAISSGVFGFPVDVCADTILKAIVEFSGADPGSQLNEINIVIFEDNVNEFLKAAERELRGFQSYSSTQSSLFSSSAAALSIQGAHPFSVFNDCSPDHATILPNISLDSKVTLHIYGETEPIVRDAEKMLRVISSLQSTIATTFHTEEITDPCITAFSDETLHELESFANDHNVNIEIDRDPNLYSVNLRGLFQDVMLVKDKIREATSSITREQSKKRAAALVSKTVRWIRINP
ncbi:PREDICTED: poly [ADP-ribose] polymerase 14-like, partial [Amphimedon queenslandica]|uniref:Macro domain-containing protein n=2 Tax=Amphimedon queenslandica TaxID=400682 RepID=A0AAN0JVK1_AMPQE